MNPQDTTVAVEGSPEEQFFDSCWEILLSLPQGGQRRIPLQLRSLRLTPEPRGPQDFSLPGGPSIRFTWREGLLFFSNESLGWEILKNHQPADQGQLRPGDVLAWGDCLAKIWDRLSSRRATMECYSDPFSARVWPIDEGPTMVGRPGQRLNQVCLEHPTISRKHATFFWSLPGPSVLAESPRGLVMVDGTRVAPGERANLRDGATLQLGELVFRFRLIPEVAPEEGSEDRLFITSLGGFSARVGKRFLTEKNWRTQATRWLLARLAWEWGKPLAVDILLEEFWPDHDAERAKNNLNFCLSTLRQILRGETELKYVDRSKSAVQILPERLGEHDVEPILEALKMANELATQDRARACEQFEKAIRLYSGDYMLGCYMEWADRIRQNLRDQVLAGGRFALREREAEGQLARVVEMAGLLLNLEPTCQIAAASIIRAHAGLGQVQAALEQFQRSSEFSQRELGVAPDPEVVAAFDWARSRA